MKIRREHGGRIQSRSGQSGSLILEVVIAAALVALIVGPIAAALAGTVDRARAVQTRASTAAGPREASERDSWEWGPRVVAAWWRPGPSLHVKLTDVASPQGEAIVGVWAGGWLRQEAVVPEEVLQADGLDDLVVEAWDWTGLAGEELTIRVRAPGGTWGPPWRLAVPDGAGSAPNPGEGLTSVVSGDVVVHRQQASTSDLGVSWSASALPSPTIGLTFDLQPQVGGWVGATLDGRSQWWWMGEGRDVHVYF